MVSRFVRENLAFCCSALLVLIAGLRVYAFANFDVDRALAVLSVADYFKILFSSLISVLSALIPYVLFYFIVNPEFRRWVLGKSASSSFEASWRSGLLFGPLLILGAMTMTTLNAIVSGSVIVLYWLVLLFFKFASRKSSGRYRSSEPNTAESSWKQNVLLAPALMSLLFTPVIFSPWAPLEGLEIAAFEKPVEAYVIGESGDHTLLVLHRKRPIWVETGDIERRQICAKKGWGNELALVSAMSALMEPRSENLNLDNDLCTSYDK